MTLAARRLQREEYWYKELKSIYPYGLNDNVRKVGNISKNKGIVVWTLFNKQTRKFRKRPKRTTRSDRNKTKIEDSIEALLTNYKSPRFVSKLRIYIMSLPVNSMKKLGSLADVLLIQQTVPKYILLIIKDLVKFRLDKKHDSSETTEEITNKKFIKVHFRNKGIEMIDLPRILNSKTVRNAIPAFIFDKRLPVVSYSYCKTIGPTIFNFKQSIKDFNFDTDVSNRFCNCTDSPFIDSQIGHILTGNLNIIKDRKLRKLIQKGPSYREQNNINWDINLKICKKAVREYKVKWAEREEVATEVLGEWEGTVLDIMERRIENIKKKHKQQHRTYRKQVLREKRHLEYLENFQKRYVLVSADKAKNNVIVVCKKYYLDVVLSEFHCTEGSGPRTYTEHHGDIDRLVSEHIRYMHDNNIRLTTDMVQLPELYWLPKMHKAPVGSRFIAASHKCTTKPLSKLLTTCLKLIVQHYKEYSEGIARNTRANCFWIVNNSRQVLHTLKKINNTNIAIHFDSFDFSTLYTNIPRDLLLACLESLIKEAYKVRGATYITIGYNKTYWADTTEIDRTSISMEALLYHIRFLIDNIYIKVGNKVFKQSIGIPMGTDCAPLLANLFLFFYEYSYIKNHLKTSQIFAVMFRYTFRYIDDLLTINNPTFEREIPNIYPPQLVLKKTTETADRTSYLDMYIHIVGKKFFTSVFDKRDAFKFYIVNFPHLDSNIPTKPAYGVYISQLVRIGRICDRYEDFKVRHCMLTHRLLKQGYRYDNLCSTFKKFYNTYAEIVGKFKITYKQHIKDGVGLPLNVIHGLNRWVTTRHRTCACTHS